MNDTEVHLVINTLRAMKNRLELEVQQVSGLMIFLQKQIDEGKIGKEE